MSLLLHLLLKYKLRNPKKTKPMLFTLEELNELYYALVISRMKGNFTNHDLNEFLQVKIDKVINDYHESEE